MHIVFGLFLHGLSMLCICIFTENLSDASRNTLIGLFVIMQFPVGYLINTIRHRVKVQRCFGGKEVKEYVANEEQVRVEEQMGEHHLDISSTKTKTLKESDCLTRCLLASSTWAGGCFYYMITMGYMMDG